MFEWLIKYRLVTIMEGVWGCPLYRCDAGADVDELMTAAQCHVRVGLMWPSKERKSLDKRIL